LNGQEQDCSWLAENWIDLDVKGDQDWNEIERLVLEGYRHYALKRMLKELGDK
jgi:hypothetical protein